MHRIEGATEDSDRRPVPREMPQVRMCPSPSTMYFTEVRPSRPTGPRAWNLSVEIPISAPGRIQKPSAKTRRGIHHHRTGIDLAQEPACFRDVLGDDALGMHRAVQGDA